MCKRMNVRGNANRSLCVRSGQCGRTSVCGLASRWTIGSRERVVVIATKSACCPYMIDWEIRSILAVDTEHTRANRLQAGLYMTVWLHTPFRLFAPAVLFFAHRRFLGGKDAAFCYGQYGRLFNICTTESTITKSLDNMVETRM